MNCPDVAAQCPDKPGQMTGTGHARAYTNPGHCPVPEFVPEYPADVPLYVSRVSFLAQVERLLDEQVLTAWQRAFVVGCRKHSDAGRQLSPKQVAVLQRLLDIASDSPAGSSAAYTPSHIAVQQGVAP